MHRSQPPTSTNKQSAQLVQFDASHRSFAIVASINCSSTSTHCPLLAASKCVYLLQCSLVSKWWPISLPQQYGAPAADYEQLSPTRQLSTLSYEDRLLEEHKLIIFNINNLVDSYFSFLIVGGTVVLAVMKKSVHVYCLSKHCLLSRCHVDQLQSCALVISALHYYCSSAILLTGCLGGHLKQPLFRCQFLWFLSISPATSSITIISNGNKSIEKAEAPI